MEEKSWNEMNGWEKALEVTKITFGGLATVAVWMLIITASDDGGGTNTYGGGSVWTVGGGGKKPGSWSSGRHS